MSLVVAYAYSSEKALPEQLAVLRAGTDWTWHLRDSELWGEYISAHAVEEGLMVKIFVEGEGYLFEFKCMTPEAEARVEERTRLVLRRLAPLVMAEGVHAAQPNN
ncbi:MAG: hypothetical protein R3357_14330 [Burkholderiales bacterium]|nr:hypothetical protein [Burkholderiales bacterium]